MTVDPHLEEVTAYSPLGRRAAVAEVVAALGGFVLGLLASLTVTYFGGQWENVGVFSLLVIILVFRPTGLLGQIQGDRA